MTHVLTNRCVGSPVWQLEQNLRAQTPGCAAPGWSAGCSREDRAADSHPPWEAGDAGRRPEGRTNIN